MGCHWLKAVCRWATEWQDDDGNFLLSEDPTRGFRKITPHEKNPKRPIATYDRYLKIRAVTDKVMMDVRWTGRRIPKRSHLSEVLDLAFFTGRRISAICALTHGDLRLDVGPYGAIRWPADSDKMDREWENIPMEPGARQAIDRILEVRTVVTDDTPLFPSPKDRTKSIRYELAGDWLKRAEKLAGVPKQPKGLWHCYRRGWATARKTMSTADVAALGGWGCEAVLRDIYQQADMTGMIEVIEAQAKLRDAK
jgi:integrase